MADTISTPLRPAWRLKMVIFIVVSLGLGAWGYYDASVAYPRRGERFAEFIEQRYLQALDQQRPGQLTAEAASVENPEQRLERLREIEDSQQRQLAAIEQTRLRWLRALATVRQLNPERTTFEDPRARLDALTSTWANQNPPKPLHWYDITIQWVIFGVFTAVGVGLLIWVSLVASRRFHWEPDTRTLILPGGQRITPDDLEDVDKRKWDKFFVFLRLRPDHPELGGRELKIDLYRRAKIEGWILEMERQRFPERAEAAADQDDAADGNAEAGGAAHEPQDQPETDPTTPSASTRPDNA